MSSLEWEWNVPGGDLVRARVDLPERVESVWVGPRLASRSAPGGKPEGHAFLLAGGASVRVAFAGNGCTLTVDGQSLLPARSPAPAAGKTGTVIAGLVAAMFGVLGASGGAYAVRGLLSPSWDKQVATVSEELNRRCPMSVDAETRLDNTMPGPGKALTYNYTLLSLEAEHVDVAQLKSNVEPMLVNRARTNDTLLRHGIGMRYHYSDKRGRFLFEVSVDP